MTIASELRPTSAPRRATEVVALEVLEERARERRQAGESVQTGWVLPDGAWLVVDEMVCSGVVDSAEAAGLAITALLRGCNLLVAIGTDLPERQAGRFLADAADLGDVLRPVPPEAAPDLPITEEQATILGLLAEGTSIVAAAERMYLSVRTCERRIGQARKALGVRSTAEAVAVVQQRGGTGGGM